MEFPLTAIPDSTVSIGTAPAEGAPSSPELDDKNKPAEMGVTSVGNEGKPVKVGATPVGVNEPIRVAVLPWDGLEPGCEIVKGTGVMGLTSRKLSATLWPTPLFV